MVLPYLGVFPLLISLLPHGVLELAVFFVSIGLVFAIKKHDFAFKKKITKKFFPYLLSLLIAAGLIEVFITPKIFVLMIA